MPPDKHALLSPSSSARWIACPPSALLNANADDTPSEYAVQGTQAHSLCEYKVNKALGNNVSDPTPDLTFFDEEMDECSDEYRNFIIEQIEQLKQHCKDPMILIEQKLDFSHWVKDSFGTADCIIVADDVLTVIDFKYGLGVLVSAKENSQMRMYALGALDLFFDLYDIRTVRMIIFQPRRENVSTDEMSVEELIQWANETLIPKAKLAEKGEGEFRAGEHCRFCKVKAECRKRAEHNLEIARYDFKPPDTLSKTEIAAVLDRLDELIYWADDVKAYALKQALNGESYQGYKVVEGRSNRRYTDETAVVETVKKAGYDPYDIKVKNITNMTKMLGKAKFEELLSSLIEKPKGKPALVPVSDKRKPIDNAVYAAQEFKEEM